jgi:hypothetical protein
VSLPAIYRDYPAMNSSRFNDLTIRRFNAPILLNIPLPIPSISLVTDAGNNAYTAMVKP